MAGSGRMPREGQPRHMFLSSRRNSNVSKEVCMGTTSVCNGTRRACDEKKGANDGTRGTCLGKSEDGNERKGTCVGVRLETTSGLDRSCETDVYLSGICF